MTYRLNNGEWRDAKTNNISVSGVLFVAESIVECGAPLEMRLVLSGEHANAGQGCVACHGEVVRIQTVSPGDRQAVAATIETYRLFTIE